MALGSVGKNSAEEFFETILYMTAYEESKSIIQGFSKDIESPILKEAVESSMNVLVFGAVMLAVRAQESLISIIFNKAEAIFVLLLIGPAKKALSKMRQYKGIKLFRRMGFFNGSNMENIGTAQTIAIHQGFKSSAQSLTNPIPSNLSTYQMQVDTKNSLYARENLHMNMGSSMASRYNETLLFKLLTKSFTPQDETLMKKILGRDSASTLHVDDLNDVADFMYTKDSNGKLTGLSSQFMELINGLGYLHNK